MSVRKDASKQSKQKDKEVIKTLIQNVGSHWPDLVITEDLLRNPTTEFVKTFYGRVYLEFEKVINYIKTNKFQEEVCSEERSIYNDDIKLAIKMKKLCEPLGVPFNLNDICEPQPKRTVMYFSVLMNFVIFLKSKTGYLDDFDACFQKDKHFKELKLSKDVLLEEIQNLNELQVVIEYEAVQLNQDIENLRGEHKDVLMQKAKRDFQYQQDYKVIDKLKNDITASEDRLSQLREKFYSLQEQIVNENEVEELKIEIDKLKQELENFEINRDHITSSLEKQEEIAKYYEKCLASIEDHVFSSDNLIKLKNDIELLAATQREVNKFDEQHILKTSEMKCFQEKCVKLEEHLHKSKQELEDLNIANTKNLAMMTQSYTDLVSKIQKDQELFKSYKNEEGKLLEIISLLKEDISLMKSYFCAKYEEFQEKQGKVFSRFNEALLNIQKTQTNH